MVLCIDNKQKKIIDKYMLDSLVKDRLSKKRKKLKAEQENQTRLVYLDIVCLLRFGTVDQTANKIFNTSIEPSISFVIPNNKDVFQQDKRQSQCPRSILSL